jgi:Heterokaryon incompatibility protein (HET)
MKSGEYDRDEFNPGLLPPELEEKMVSLEINGEVSDENEFTVNVDVDGAVGIIRRADSVLKKERYYVENQMPWIDPKFEIGAYQQLNSQAIQRCLEECERTHPRCRTIQQATIAIPEYATLFIDVEEGCLVTGSLGYRYLALSYVWGNKQMLETTQETVVDLQRKGALLDKGHSLPRVIKDSMKLTQLLGERYLWIDVLCIVQDDSVNKMRHISNMDAIYKQALLTIIAHSGTSSDSPLPGVVDGTRFPIVTSRKVGGMSLICQPKYYCAKSTYTTRGWTYQEEILSSRRLYLYHSHAAFQCCTIRYRDVLDKREDVHLEKNYVDWMKNPVSILQYQFGSSKTRQALPFDAEAYESYNNAVSEFSHRQLTFPEDTINAFSGVMRVMEKLFGTRFCKGLPEAFIDAALLWSSQPKGRHYNYENGPETHLKIYLRRPEFPSWSWSGHGGNLDLGGFRIFLTAADPKTIRSEILGFAILSPDGLPRRLFRTPCPLVEMPEGDSDITQNLESMPTPEVGNRSILCFPSRVVCADLLPIDGYPGRLATGRIFTANGKFCGLLFPDDSECWREKPLGLRKWLILSRANVSGPEEDVAERAGSFTELFDTDIFNFHSKWSFYNIMLVEERGDVVERIALGHIHIDAWPCDKETKEMVFLG